MKCAWIAVKFYLKLLIATNKAIDIYARLKWVFYN